MINYNHRQFFRKNNEECASRGLADWGIMRVHSSKAGPVTAYKTPADAGHSVNFPENIQGESSPE